MRNIPFSPPDITEFEIAEVTKILRSGWITTGAKTKMLEKKIAEYVGTSKAVCLNSATAAMEMTLRILGIGEGDEVITSAYTYTASAAVIHHVGAKIILVDTKPNSFEMDYSQVEQAITSRTKAVIPVDIGGKMCKYEELVAVLDSKKYLYQPAKGLQELFERPVIVADSAHGFGAKQNCDGRVYHSGALADFTCFSFHAVKNLTTGEGGAVTWRERSGIDNEALYKEYMLYSLHGQNKDAFAKSQLGAWEYDIVYPAYKCNMPDTLAAIGLTQLERYEGLLARRRNIIEQYDKAFALHDFERLGHYNEGGESSGHLYLLRIPGIGEVERNETICELAKRGIATNVHYKPLPMMTAYKKMGFDISDFPNAYQQYANEITLPLHTLLSDEDVEYIITNVVEVVNTVKEQI